MPGLSVCLWSDASTVHGRPCHRGLHHHVRDLPVWFGPDIFECKMFDEINVLKKWKAFWHRSWRGNLLMLTRIWAICILEKVIGIPRKTTIDLQPAGRDRLLAYLSRFQSMPCRCRLCIWPWFNFFSELKSFFGPRLTGKMFRKMRIVPCGRGCIAHASNMRARGWERIVQKWA